MSHNAWLGGLGHPSGDLSQAPGPSHLRALTEVVCGLPSRTGGPGAQGTGQMAVSVRGDSEA